jgi:hypothetical protein
MKFCIENTVLVKMQDGIANVLMMSTLLSHQAGNTYSGQ